MTLEELHRYAWGVPMEDVAGPLQELHAAGLVFGEGEYVTLARAGKTQLPSSLQHERAAQAEPLFRRAERFSRAALRLPFIRGIFLVNSLALGTNGPASDIDLFVITARGRIWIGRALVTLLAHLLGVRRHGALVEGRVCLSFFATEDALDCSVFRLEDDPYLAAWVASAVPLGGSVGRAELLAGNAWVAETFPNLTVPEPHPPVSPRLFERVLARTQFAAAAEWVARAVLRPRTLRHARALGADAGTIVTDARLKFHDRDRRAFFRDRWRAILAEVAGEVTDEPGGTTLPPV